MKTLIVFAVLSISATAGAQDEVVSAVLSGFNEVPAISTAGNGLFRAVITSGSIQYTLFYADLEGLVEQAHIHFGQAGVNGGVSAFLCSNLDSPPAGTPACPASGAVSGTITADSIIGPSGQGIDSGELEELIAAIRSGFTYVNVHTDLHSPGEIRGKIE